MSLPRLSEVGDQVALTVRMISRRGEGSSPSLVDIVGDDSADVLTLPALGVDAAWRRLGFTLPSGGNLPEIVDDQAALGERLIFSRTKNPNGGRPLWRIEKAAAVARPVDHGTSTPPPAPRPVPIDATGSSTPAGITSRTAERLAAVTERTAQAQRATLATKPASSSKSIEEQRAEIRDAYKREAEWVVAELVPLMRKKKIPVAFDANASVGSLMMEMSRKRCL